MRAPIGGRISEKFVSVGNVVSGGQAGSTVLTTIVAIDPIHFVFDASEADYLRYNRLNASGSRRTSRETPNPVRIRLLDETAFTHIGHMDFVDNRLDTTTGTIRGRALVANPGGFLTLDGSGDCSCSARANSTRSSYRTAPSKPISPGGSSGPSTRRTCRNSASSSPAGSNAVFESCGPASSAAIGW